MKISPKERKVCDCGRPAVKRLYNEYICARCAAIETRQFKTLERKNKGNDGRFREICMEPYAVHLPT